MGTGKRIKPLQLAEKLKAIRDNLGLTAEEIIIKLDCPVVPLHRASITQYEKGRREPPLIILLQYARLAKTHVDDLIDDNVGLEDISHKRCHSEIN